MLCKIVSGLYNVTREEALSAIILNALFENSLEFLIFFASTKQDKQFFSCMFEIVWSPNENKMLQAKVVSILARFCDDIWELWEGFVKICISEDSEGSMSGCWMVHTS